MKTTINITKYYIILFRYVVLTTLIHAYEISKFHLPFSPGLDISIQNLTLS